ncbi:zinc-ribbon domain-containing protein [Desemzia sp. FAM 23990]|uniref:zinc-ribbon domain-containing protein n=1 Tax=Desemzia sp. FAM 23990 TaxID=3259520 RepID=UPI0038850E3E
MKYCSNCGNEIKEGAKFCNGCGANTISEEMPNHQPSSTKGEQVINLSAINIDKEKISTMSHGYFAYFKTTLVKPSKSLNEGSSINGVIQFILLSLIQVLSVWFLSMDSYSYSYVSIGFRMLLGVFLLLTLFNFLSVFVVHGVKKLFYQSEHSFLTTATQYGGYFSSSVLLHAIIMVLALITGVGFADFMSILYILSFMVSFFAFANYLYKSDGKSKMDRFYVGIIATLVLFLVWFVVARIGSETVVSVLEDIIMDSLF